MPETTPSPLAARILAFVAPEQGHDWAIQAAARLAAASPLVLAKIAPWVEADGWIQWPEIARHVDESGWSSGEKCIIRFACSLAGEEPPRDYMPEWTIRAMLYSLDSRHAELAAQALRHAATGRGVQS